MTHRSATMSWEFHTRSRIRSPCGSSHIPSHSLARTEQQVDKTSKRQQVVADDKVLQIQDRASRSERLEYRSMQVKAKHAWQ